MTDHIWVPSTLNHGSQQCKKCLCTYEEARYALGMECPKADPVPAPMTDAEKIEIATMLQDIGDAIAGVFDQMKKGDWHDDMDHPVKNNAQMLHLKDVLAAMIQFRAANPWTLELRKEVTP